MIFAPSYNYVKEAESLNAHRSDECLGFLSFDYGVLPINAPLQYLPASHTAWDALAYAIPQHYKQQDLRRACDAMPILSAQKKDLPDVFLPRAAHLLCFLAHAYIRCEYPKLAATALPMSILKPWREVSERLLRPYPLMTFDDLITYNWRFKHENLTERLFDNMTVLTPIFNNQEEIMLFMTQTAMMSAATPLINNIVSAQNAIVNDDTEGVEKTLLAMSADIQKISRIFSDHIVAPKGREASMNPVIFSKTIMSFPVPIEEERPGPSGAAYIPFHFLDEFIERKRYNTQLDKEVLFIRSSFSPHHQRFMKAIKEVSIRQFLEKNKHKTNIFEAYNVLLESYSGDAGFLGVHQNRIYSFIQTAFKAGRDETVGGFEGELEDERWVTIYKELQTSREERFDAPIKRCPFSRLFKSTTPSQKIWHLSEIAQRNNTKNGHWLIVKESVFDMSQFYKAHPGGEEVVFDNTGRDATKEFELSHALLPKAAAMLPRFQIGIVSDFWEKMPKNDQKIYFLWRELLFKAVEAENAFRLESITKDAVCFENEAQTEFYPFKAVKAYQTHLRCFQQYLPLLQPSIKDLSFAFDTQKLLEELTFDYVNDLLYEKIKYENAAYFMDLFEKDFKILAHIKAIIIDGMKQIENNNTDMQPFLNKLEAVLYLFNKQNKRALALSLFDMQMFTSQTI